MRNDALLKKTRLLMIFTDLDGTLLDHETYRWDKAKPALTLCKKLEIPLILASSKTRAEIDTLRFELGLSSPFISENGGGIFFPAESALEPPSDAVLFGEVWKWSLGRSYPELVAALREIRDELYWTIRGFSDMTVEEISALTGLDSERARLAAMREYDEPFIVSNRKEIHRERLIEAAEKRGLMITEGGRFYHLQGFHDKGQALDKLTRWFKTYYDPVKTVALGDGPNDFSMLKRVDYPVLVKSSRSYPELFMEIPSLMTTAETGPAGWNAAVSDILVGKWNRGEQENV